MFKKLAVLAIPLLLATSSVQAGDYKIEFAMSGFQPPEPGIGPSPYDSAAGSLVFSAASPSAEWTALREFNLTIGDVTYALNDVDYQNLASTTSVQGNLNPNNGLFFGTNDFAFDVFREEQFAYFYFTSEAAPGVWVGTVSPLNVMEVTASVVPEVQTTALLFAGLGLMGTVARRRRL